MSLTTHQRAILDRAHAPLVETKLLSRHVLTRPGARFCLTRFRTRFGDVLWMLWTLADDGAVEDQIAAGDRDHVAAFVRVAFGRGMEIERANERFVVCDDLSRPLLSRPDPYSAERAVSRLLRLSC